MRGVFKRQALYGCEFPMSFERTRTSLLIVFCLALAAFSGCVTRTERISPYEQTPKDESVWDEIRREFSGRDSGATTRESSSEPLYKRAARSVKETVAGWFQDDAAHLSEQEIAADRRRFERKRAQALEQLREQQEEETTGQGE
jgi:hypothetical protein